MVHDRVHGAFIQTSETARQLHDDIEASLEPKRSAGVGLPGKVSNVAKGHGRAAWLLMKRHPFASALAVGLGGVALAMTMGVAEVAFAGAIAFGAYKVLREGEPPMKALEELEKDVSV